MSYQRVNAGALGEDGDGAVAVVHDLVVAAVRGEDVGVGAAGVEVGVHDRAGHAFPVVREYVRSAALVEGKLTCTSPSWRTGTGGRDVVAVEQIGKDVVEVSLVQRRGGRWRADGQCSLRWSIRR